MPAPSPAAGNTAPIFLSGKPMAKLYNEVLVSYDIEDSRNRAKLFNKLKGLGLAPVQKSVFWGYLNAAEERCAGGLLRDFCARGDKGFVVRVNLAEQIAAPGAVGYDPRDFPAKPPAYYVL